MFVQEGKIILLMLASFQVLIAFATNYLVVKKIGFGDELDVFYIAMAVFGYFSTSVGWSISSVLTTILIKNKEDNLGGKMLVNVMLLTCIALAIALLCMFFGMHLLYAGYIDSVGYRKIIIIQSLLILTFCISNLNVVFLAMLQENNQYIKINTLNMFSAVIGFAIVYFTIEMFGVYAAALSQLGMQIFLFAIMFSGALIANKIILAYDFKTFYMLWQRMKFVFVGSLYYRTEELTERFISSYFSVGFLSLFGFVQRVYGALITIVNTSIAGPTITKFSYCVKNKEFNKIKSLLTKYLLLIFIFDAIIFLIIIFTGENLFLYFFREAVNENISNDIFTILIVSFGMVFGSTLGQVIHNILLSMQIEKEITICDSVTFTLNLLIKVIGAFLFGMMGFLIATVVGVMIKNSAKAYLLFRTLKNVT